MPPKPPSCQGCPLQSLSTGFMAPGGPEESPILFIGEALGREEVEAGGAPFVGASGRLLNSRFKAIGYDRDQARVGNVVWCRPPNNELSGQPYEYAAISHCSQHLKKLLDEPYHKIIVTLGVTATRTVCSHFGIPFGGFMDHWRGTVNPTGDGRFIVPAYHPSFILQGGRKLLNVWREDLRKAWQLAMNEIHPSDEPDLWLDPPSTEFNQWAETVKGKAGLWLAADIETPHQDLDEFDLTDENVEILRIAFATSPNFGVTIPFEPDYFPGIRALLEDPTSVKLFWNWRFDVKRLKAKGFPVFGKIFDGMDAQHMLQADLKGGEETTGVKIRGHSLGFAAAVYLLRPAWKHLSNDEPARYSALDVVNTYGTIQGLYEDLVKADLLTVFDRHYIELNEEVLIPAENAGLPLDREALDQFDVEVSKHIDKLTSEINSLVPPSCCPYAPPKGWKRQPDEDKHPNAVQRKIVDKVKVCTACGEVEVGARHKCSNPAMEVIRLAGYTEEQEYEIAKKHIVDQQLEVTRWFVQEPFNPASPPQIRKLLEFYKIRTGRSKDAKTNAPSTNKQALQKAAKKKPVFQHIVDLRSVEKTKGTYIDPFRERLGKDGRIHTTFLRRPSTQRLSSENPNLQNVTNGDSDEMEEKAWGAGGIRRCVKAPPGSCFVSIDFKAIEAVLTGWFAKDPSYIKASKLGIHNFFTAFYLGKLLDLDAPDIKRQLAAYDDVPERKPIKAFVHGTSYGQTAKGRVERRPDLFTLESSIRIEEKFYELFPKIREFQKHVRYKANRYNLLGGSDHPYHYRHWFFDVLSYRDGKTGPGSDYNRAAAFFGQSTAAGVIFDKALACSRAGLKEYIRLLIHDEIFFEVPLGKLEWLIETATREMTAPILELPMPEEWGLGPYLCMDVSVEAGLNWLDMDKNWRELL